MKKVLFSPVGATDPIRGYHDGGLLHIARVYRPDVIYLYLSQEMLKKHEEDDRYRYCLKRLGVELDHTFEIRIISRPELKNVQIFEYFTKDFDEVIREICAEQGDEEFLLYVNVASGTPAMKSALQVISSLAERRIIAVQVASPEQQANRERPNYEFEDGELYWETNEDNAEDFVNRCAESTDVNFRAKIAKEIIAKHIRAYDYVAAFSVAESVREFLSKEAICALQGAIARLKLDRTLMDRCFAAAKIDPLPVKSGDARDIFEYLLGLELKLKKEEYADFLRGITPVFMYLLELAVQKGCNIDIKSYYQPNRDVSKKIWDDTRLRRNPDLKRLVDEKSSTAAPVRFAISSHLVEIINRYSRDSKINALVKELRAVEIGIRNPAAHAIVAVTKNSIKLETGYLPEEIFRKMKDLAKYVGIASKEEYWNSYDAMNEQILELVNGLVK